MSEEFSVDEAINELLLTNRDIRTNKRLMRNASSSLYQMLSIWFITACLLAGPIFIATGILVLPNIPSEVFESVKALPLFFVPFFLAVAVISFFVSLIIFVLLKKRNLKKYEMYKEKLEESREKRRVLKEKLNGVIPQPTSKYLDGEYYMENSELFPYIKNNYFLEIFSLTKMIILGIIFFAFILLILTFTIKSIIRAVILVFLFFEFCVLFLYVELYYNNCKIRIIEYLAYLYNGINIPNLARDKKTGKLAMVASHRCKVDDSILEFFDEIEENNYKDIAKRYVTEEYILRGDLENAKKVLDSVKKMGAYQEDKVYDLMIGNKYDDALTEINKNKILNELGAIRVSFRKAFCLYKLGEFEEAVKEFKYCAQNGGDLKYKRYSEDYINEIKKLAPEFDTESIPAITHVINRIPIIKSLTGVSLIIVGTFLVIIFL